WAAATPIDPHRRAVFPVGALHRPGLGTESFEWVDPPPAGTEGGGTDAASLSALLSLPENRLMEVLGNRLASAVPPPSEADLTPFSPWGLALGDLGVALTRTEGRWILELLLSALLTSPRAFGGDPVAPVDEAVIQRTVHETTRDWTNEAFLSFLEPGFQRVGDGPRAVREAFLARIPPWAYPGEIRKAWGGPVLPVEDSPERVAEAAQREALALGRSVADRLVELQADAPRTATTKPDGTKVSRADEEAMVTLASGILEAFPTHEIIGEEDLEPLAPELHRRNRANAGSPYQWFIDPLDGTETYLGGTDIFAVHLELQHEGRPLLAVVALPRKGPDGGPLVVMARAGRAGLWVNGQWHAPAPPENFPTDFAQLTAVAHGKPAIGEPYPFFQRVRALFGETVPRVGSSGLWLTGLALRRVGLSVPGLPDNYSYYASQRVKSWDVAAPGFLLENAGGVLEVHDHGRPFFPLHQRYEDKEAKFSVLAALTPEGAAAWRRAVLESASGDGDRAGPAAASRALPRLEIIHPDRVAGFHPQIAFFDLDGTLWRSTPYDVRALRWAQFLYGETNVTPERFAALREFFVEHDRGDLRAQIAALDAWATERNVGKRVTVVDGRERAQNIEAETRRVRARPDLRTPGVRALLDSLTAAGIPLEVVTSGNEDTTQKTLNGLELTALFRRLHPGGDKEKAVRERLMELGLSAAGAVLIGNDARDMKAARGAGALAVGIAIDEPHAAPLRAAGADVIVHGDFSDLGPLRELLTARPLPGGPAPGPAAPGPRVEILRPERVAAADLRLCFFDINGTLWRGYPFETKAELWSRFLFNDAHPAPERIEEVRRFFIDTDWMNWGEQEKALAAWARERGLAAVHSPAGRERSEEIRKIVNKELVGLATPERVLPGARALLEFLRKAGVRLEVATSGSVETRTRVLRGLGLSEFFGTLHGGGKKGDVIGRRLSEEGLTGTHAVLIGDGR
ncbi:MAG TPA: inositol monophosphatase family protein, partial [Elusimicrobiota bacterium]|nr:inositol monophosphatase family protein [Elusimicrobiota bacterium]